MTEEPRETSSATIALLLRHVREHGGPDAEREVLTRAGLTQTAQQLAADSTWIGYDTRIRLFEAATAVLDDPRTMFAVGASAATDDIHPVLIQLLSAFGTPGAVYRQLPRMVPKFTTTSTMDSIEVGRAGASIRYRLHDGYRHSRLDCEYAQGLFAAVPTIFGLDRAVVVHRECQSDGYPSCVYEVTWSKRPRWWARRARRDVEVSLAALRDKVTEVQVAAADLVASDDMDEVLARIVDRAVSAVLAPAYLLVVDVDGAEPLVRSRGLDDAAARVLAGQIQRGEDLGDRALVVEIVSARRMHGHLAALFTPGHTSMGGDQALLNAYAGHAAAALDLFTALEDSRREGERLTALLDLARRLAALDGAQDVADVIVAAIPPVVGCDAAAVLTWNPVLGVLEAVATARLSDIRRDRLMRTPIEAAATPELVDLLAQHQPVLISTRSASPLLSRLLADVGSSEIAVVPLLAGDTLMGVAVAAWTAEVGLDVLHEGLARIEGVSNLGARALENARLLATVRHQSLHDSLTGLPNRVLFARKLRTTLKGSVTDASTAVLFCDLDNFKRINDELGHGAGDELLRQVAMRLRAQVRPSDVIGRLGGDEFAILVTDAPGEGPTEELARRIVDSLNVPFHLSGRDVRITTSVGVALQTGPGGHGERLLAAADTAMYAAKRTGRNQVAVADDVAPEDPTASLDEELGAALARDELRLHYQPVVDITVAGSERIVGAEALIRWEHPRLGLLAPAAFLPLAEESGAITELDLWAVGTACAALSGWPGGEDPPLTVAVNLASATLVDPRLLPTVRAALTRNHLAPDRLMLEVVESRALVDLPGVIERLTELRQFGVRISLDDFGTGFSTLSWLKSLPVDQIKIDRTFIMDLPDPASAALVDGLLALAHKLGIEVVAEGVETREQLDALQAAGCELAQGYLLGRPAGTFSAEAVHVPRREAAAAARTRRAGATVMP